MNTAIPLKLFFIGTLLVFVLRRKSSSNLVPSLLTTNMHLPIGLFCILIPNSYTRSLNKRLHQTLSVDDDRLCRLRASFMMGAVQRCTIHGLQPAGPAGPAGTGGRVQKIFKTSGARAGGAAFANGRAGRVLILIF